MARVLFLPGWTCFSTLLSSSLVSAGETASIPVWGWRAEWVWRGKSVSLPISEGPDLSSERRVGLKRAFSMLFSATSARYRDWRISSVLASTAVAEFLRCALTCFSTRRRLSNWRAAGEPGFFRCLFAYSLSQNSSSLSSLSGSLGCFSVSELFPGRGAKVNSAVEGAIVEVDTVSATTGGKTLVTRILDGISTGWSSIADWLRFMLVSVDAAGTFNDRSKRPIAASLTPSDDKGRREAGTVVVIMLDTIGPWVSIYL